ncbi:MAG: replication-relaxation family protein [Actinobacteria bacterium]|nr:replication-relaxation family protein [Actinomycetota bacterium]MBI3687399.1 replication-relaxation family protein [Actinomycetota bacterium]
MEVSHRLRPRDYTLASLLAEHTTLTTEQITMILFTSPTTCRHRLHALRGIGFVDRFIRRRPGAGSPVCWVSGPLAARYSALAAGEPPPTARIVRERQDRVYATPLLEHLLAVNGFFAALLAHARQDPGTRLQRWWSERTTSAAFGRRIHPDGHGVWVENGTSVGFHLELDRGTEPLARLGDKLAPHRRLHADGGVAYPVLFVLPNRTREQNLHRRLATHPEPGVIVATTSPEAGGDPAGPVWRIAGNGRHRLRLADLPAGHGHPSPLNPGPPEPDHDPLWLLTAG